MTAISKSTSQQIIDWQINIIAKAIIQMVKDGKDNEVVDFITESLQDIFAIDRFNTKMDILAEFVYFAKSKNAVIARGWCKFLDQKVDEMNEEMKKIHEKASS